jgi:DNA-binding CsgD family transcriptional regulator
LTAREIEVARLVAAGKSTREIADMLFISARTAQTHVTNILGKLDLDSRAALAAWVVRNDPDGI